MLKNTIKVSDETKQSLNQISTKYNFKIYDSCISSIANFIIRNEINPKDDFLGDYKLELIRLEKRLIDSLENYQKKLTKDNGSLRNWVGGITKEYLVPLTQKLSVLDKLNHYEIINKISNDLQSNKINNPLNSHLYKNEVEENTPNDNNIELEKLTKKYKDLYSKYDDQKQVLFKIINSVKVEEGGMISKEKIILNMPLDEWNEIKKSI